MYKRQVAEDTINVEYYLEVIFIHYPYISVSIGKVVNVSRLGFVHMTYPAHQVLESKCRWRRKIIPQGPNILTLSIRIDTLTFHIFPSRSAYLLTCRDGALYDILGAPGVGN